MGNLTELTEDGYSPGPFTPNQEAVTLHGYSRFGYTNCIEDALSDQKGNEYLAGILAGSLFILMVFLVWTLTLIILRCLGRRVGCASGTPRRPAKPVNASTATGSRLRNFNPYEEGADEQFLAEGAVPADKWRGEDATPRTLDSQGDATESIGFFGRDYSDYEGADLSSADVGATASGKRVETSVDGAEVEYQQALERWERDVKRHERRMAITRGFFLFSGCAVIVSSFLFYFKGVQGLANSLRSFDSSIQLGQTFLLDAHNLTTGFISAQAGLVERRDTLHFDAADYCPALVQKVEERNFTEEAEIIRKELKLISERVGDLNEELSQSAVDLKNDLSEAIEITGDISNNVNKLTPVLWAGVAVIATLDLIVLLLMVSAILNWCQLEQWYLFRCMRNFFCMPVLILLMFLAWLLATVFAMGAVASADFCVAPDIHVNEALEAYKDDLSPVLFHHTQFIVQGCRGDLKPHILRQYANVIRSVVQPIHDFLNIVGNDESVLTELCGGKSLFVQELASALHIQLHIMWDSLVGVIQLLQCGSLNLIYTGILHDAVCINGVGALAWIFATQLCIAVFTMTMVTLRASWHKIEVEKEYVFASLEEDNQRRKESEKGEWCTRWLLVALVLLMVAALVTGIVFGLNGFKNSGENGQCFAEHRQFMQNHWSHMPSAMPSKTPSQNPSAVPSVPPSSAPTISFMPTYSPSNNPTISLAPSGTPSTRPSNQPSAAPTHRPTAAPSPAPTAVPTTAEPTVAPTSQPTWPPTRAPTGQPTWPPTRAPSVAQSVVEGVLPTVGDNIFSRNTSIGGEQ